MKARETLITLTALVAIGLTSFFAYRYERRPEPNSCPFCDRMIHARTAFRIAVGGRIEVACCPRCGLHYQAHHPHDVQKAWVADLNSSDPIPAELATYEEGGDVEYCARPDHAVEREPQGVAVRAYDRCLPTLVAFKTRSEAEDYQKQHGGRVLTFAEAMKSVQEQ